MEKAKYYLELFRTNTTPEGRTALLADYQAYLSTLAEPEREAVRQFMQMSLRPQLLERIKTLDALAEKAELLLNRKGKVTYEGKDYYFGDWVTIADYCRLYNVKPARVQNWIDRDKVPAENVVIIPELNNLKLLKNIRYSPL